MSKDFSEDEILENDIDPIDGINEIRRAESTEEEEEKPVEPSAEEEEETVSDVVKEELDTDEDAEDAEKSTETEEPVKRTFKASGKEYSFTEKEMLEQFEGVFGKAINFTQKTQKLKPYSRMISALEEQDLTEDQFNLALDLLKGDKEAIKKLAKDKDIDLNDLMFGDDDKENFDYTPNQYGKSDFDLKLEEIQSQIGSDPEYPTTVNVIDNEWDQESRTTVAANPDIIKGLHHDIKSGVYNKVAPEATKLQLLGGSSKSSLDYYLLAGAEYQKSLDSQDSKRKIEDMNKGTQEAESKFEKGSLEAQAKRAAQSTGTRSGQNKVVDYLDDVDDEKFNAWYKKLEQAN